MRAGVQELIMSIHCISTLYIQDGRYLAQLIPSSEYLAGDKQVKQYCCANFCRVCRGAVLYNGVKVMGFEPTTKGSEPLLTLRQFCQPKREHCTWRLSKRRLRGVDGKLKRHEWLGICVQCDGRKKVSDDAHNNKAKKKRHRLKQYELDCVRSGNRVQV